MVYAIIGISLFAGLAFAFATIYARKRRQYKMGINHTNYIRA
jgi:hypothetical protein